MYLPNHLKSRYERTMQWRPHTTRLKPRRGLITGLLLIAIIGTGVLYFFSRPGSVSAAWMDDSWGYRQTVAITNAGTAQTDFQVAITLNTSALVTAGKMQSDCDDIRITDIGGKVLPIWIETGANACNTTTTAIWTKVPSISTTGTTVYLYYGNPSATSVQNGSNVFLFFDDFAGSAIDANKWTITDSTGWSVSGGELTGTNTTGRIQTIQTFTTPFIMGSRNIVTVFAANGHETLGTYISNTNAFGGFLPHGDTSAYTRSDAGWTNFNPTPVTFSSYHIDKVYGDAAASMYVKMEQGTNSYTSTAFTNTVSSEPIALGRRYDECCTAQAYNARWDWIYAGKYSSSVSIASPTNEEKSLGPVAYWKFDEGTGTNVQDSSPNNLDGSVGGSVPPTWQTEDKCISGKCLYFNGSNTANNGKVVFNETSTTPTNLTGDVTISVWVKPTANYYDTNEAIIRNGQGADLVYGVFYDPANQRPYFHWYDGAFQQSNGVTNSMPLNQWSHLTITRSGTTLTFYVNGKSSTTAIVTAPTVAASQFALGQTNNDAVAQDYTGYADEMKIYNYARTAAQIKSDFASKGSGSVKGTAVSMGSNSKNNDAFSNGLVGYWKMDEAATPSLDASGNGYSLTWGGNTTSSSGKFGNSSSFDGTTDYLTTATNLDYSSNAITTTAWIYPTESSAVRQSIISSKESSSAGFVMHLGDGGTNTLGLYVHNGAWRHVVGTTQIPINTWSFVTAIYDGIDLKVYVNGLLENTANFPGTISNTSGSTSVGARNTNDMHEFQGNLDEVRLYNRALSPREVRDLYAWAPGPVAYYNFEEGTGNTVNDSSGNNNVGTNTGGTWTTGKFGKALSFNGSVNGVSSTISNSFNDAQWSFGYWFQPKLLGVQQNHMRIDDGGLPALIRVVPGMGADNKFFVWTNDGMVSDTTTTAVLNTWYHIGGTYSNGVLSIYINGVKTNSANVSLTSAIWNRILYIGTDGGGYKTTGVFDDFKIYNYARTSGQIIEDMNAGHPLGGSPVGSQVGYWKFDEGFGITANNLGNIGSALNGTLTSSPSWSNSGKFGKALSFNGAGSYVDAGNDSSANLTNQLTITAWINPTVNDSIRTVVARHTGSNGYAFQLRNLVEAGRLTFYANGTTSTGNTVVPTGQWSYVAVTYDSGTTTVKFYLNGKLDGSNTSAGTILSQTQSLSIGRLRPADTIQAFNGLIDEVKIYNAALTEDEIKLDYNRGSAMVLGGSVENRDRVTSGQTLYLDATDKNSYPGSGTAWNDLSGNNYNATLSSPTWNGLKFTNTAATLTNLGSSVYPNIATNTTILWVYPETGGGGVWSVTDQDGHTYMSYSGDGNAYINTWETGTYNQRTVWNVTESVPHQIVITKNGSVRTVYDNLIQKGQVTITNIATSVNSNIVYGSAAQPMGLSIVETYNRVLSMDEITQDYYAHAYKFNINAEPVGEWKFDEGSGASAQDSSGGGSTGTITGATYQAGKIGKALNFNAGTDAVTVSNSISTKTVEFWVYPSTTTQNLIDLRTDATAANISVSSGTISATGFTSPTIYVNGKVSSTLSAGAWQHITITTGAAITANAIRFGRIGSTSLTGKLDLIRIFDYARTPAQIAYDYNRGGPVGWWKMDECQGVTANDSSGNGNSGTITIGATGTNTSAGTCTGSAGEAWKDGATGKFNSSLDFDGTDDYVNAGQVLATDQTKPFTFAAWAKSTSGGMGTWRTIVGTNTSFAQIAFSSSNDIRFGQNGGGGWWQTGSSIVADTWYHVVGIYDGTNARLYVNGNLVSGPNARTFTSAHGVTVMGRYQTAGGEWMNGQIDDVRIYNYALTPTQIKQVYNEGSSVRFGPVAGSP